MNSVKQRINTILERLVAPIFQEALYKARAEIILEIRRMDENNRAMNFLESIVRPRVPWTGWAMHPSAILTVVNDILLNERAVVVEFGSGLSTLYAAKALSYQNGVLISFEHDEKWAQKINKDLRELQLTSWVQVVHVELAELYMDNQQYLWYSETSVRDYLNELNSPVDLVVVDGPPASTCSHARYPALPILKPYLNERYAIILDDVARPMEQEIVTRWEEVVTAKFKTDYRARGIAYGRFGAYYEV